MKDDESYIYTDSYKTKDLIWEYFDGYTRSFNDYMSLQYVNRDDVIIRMSLYKYKMGFYDLIKVYFDEFEKPLGQDKINKMKSLSDEKNLTKEDYRFIRDFFGHFMHVTGISKVSMKKDDPDSSVHINR